MFAGRAMGAVQSPAMAAAIAKGRERSGRNNVYPIWVFVTWLALAFAAGSLAGFVIGVVVASTRRIR